MPRNASISGDGYTGDGCVFLVGESPGAIEDLRNKVFCGDTGVMFRGFIGTLIEYAKEKNIVWGKGVYYTNAVKRFYGKDGHSEKHIEYWKEDFLNEIKQIKPARILLFGKVAVDSLLPDLESITDYVGGWKRIDFGYGPIPVQICLHPTNVLRNSCMKGYWQRESGRAFLYPPDPRLADPNNVEIINIIDTNDVRYIFENFHNCKHMGYDVEYNPDNNNLYLIGMAINANKAFVFHENVIKSGVFIEELENLFLDENITFIAHNWKFDAHATQRALGIIPSVFTDQNRYWADTLSLMRIYDCERHSGLDWAEWLVGLGGHKQRLKDALRGKEARHYERAYREHPELMSWYNGVDAVATMRLYFHLKRWLTVDGLWNTWSDLIGPLGSVFYDMENVGIQIDRERLGNLGKYIDDMINVELLRVKCDPVVDRLEKSGLIEGEFNINSTDHKRILLFNEEFGLGLKSNKMTAKDKLSTDKHVLKHLNEVKDLPVLKAMEKYNKLITLKRNYIVKWGRLMDAKGCIHTNFKQTGARTLRIASSDPPVQTIPRNVLTGDDLLTDIRGKLRSTIVPHNKGNLLLEMDYSQQELRILARDSGDKEMIRCFVENIDIHRRTASMITGKSMEEVTDDDRQNAKPVNFGVIYGQSAKGLVAFAKETYGVILTEEDAEKHLKAYFGLYTGVKQHQVQLIYQAKKEGRTWVWWDGKPVHFRNVHGITAETNKALVGSCIRIVKNTHPQGGASLYTLNSLLVLKYMQRKNMIPGLVNIVGTVHDSIWFEIEEGKKTECIDLIGRVMVGFPCNTRTCEGVVIPVEVEAKLGPSLGEMKKFGAISSNKIKEGARFNYEVWKTKRVVEFY